VPRFVLRVLFVIAVLALSLGVVEGFARRAGWRPTQRHIVSNEVDGWAAYDPELGWTNRPSTRLMWNGGPATFLPDASRRTSARTYPPTAEQWLLVGCSYTQGLFLADEQTFGWLLQTQFPSVHLRNFGTGAYGSYQSLLRFRRERSTKPTLVIYGFGDFHGYRDLATRTWMRSIGDALPFTPPHVRIEDGRLVEYPLAPLPRFPLENRFGLVHLAATAYLHQFVYSENRGLVAAQQGVLRTFKREVEAMGARFLVANLWTDPPEREAWRAFFAREQFHVADCLTPDLPFDHPDVHWSRHHAACIADAIRNPSDPEQVRRSPHASSAHSPASSGRNEIAGS
jgi:hypothetical protein